MSLTNKHLVIVAAVGVLAAVVLGGVLAARSLNPTKQVACTLEAKLCPDGSAVGRVGPNCEFAQCPSSGPLAVKTIQFDNALVNLALVSDDQVTERAKDSWGGADAGAWTHEGLYTMVSTTAAGVKQSASLGKLFLAEGRAHDGSIIEFTFQPATDRRLIGYWQYESSNSEGLYLYEVTITGALKPVEIIDETGMGNRISVNDPREHIVSDKGLLTSVTYDNSEGKYTTSIYEYKEGAFRKSSGAGDLSGWQIYRNEEYGFEFKYPDTEYNPDDPSQFSAENKDERLLVSLYNIQDKRESEECQCGEVARFQIVVSSNEEKLSPASYARLVRGELDDGRVTHVDGRVAIEFGELSRFIFVSNQRGEMFIISPIDSILATFKLITSTDVEKTVVDLSGKILNFIRSKDFTALGQYVHSRKGLRFSPYQFVNVEDDRVIQVADLVQLSADRNVHRWGVYDGSGADMNLTFNEYYQRFIYDVDFSKAPTVSFDKVVSFGNTMNGIKLEYPESRFVEYYFPGLEAQSEGMDWRSLSLVFEQSSGQWYLVGIVHGEWTI